MEYTKGEWKVVGNFIYCLNNQGTNRFNLLVQGGKTDTDEITSMSELEANAKLISSCPDMYEALKNLISSYEFHCPEAKEYSKALQLGKLALAKAESK